MKLSFKTGDSVQLLSGNERGKQGKVLKIDRKKMLVLVEGINLQSHYTRKSEKDPKGGIVKREGYLHLAKLKKVAGGESKPESKKETKEKPAAKAKVAKK